jgi:manganese-transporting P-type ATPase
LRFGNGPSLFAATGANNDQLVWTDIDDKKVAVTNTPAEVSELAKTNMLCINGNVLDNVILSKEPGKTMRPIHVFSRTSPAQKGIIVGLLNLEGHKTLMCGDGTNDVGSLKRADVGLAVVNNKEPTKEEKAKKKQMSPWVPKDQLAGKSWAEVA